ncbi:MAG TPA: ABC transporter permease [Baekduia sp.]|nr:ABC transporter permease [Baekduia sp.]
MLRLLKRRLIAFPIVLFGMSLMTFALTHLVPGDPARLLAGPHASAAQVAELRHQYGFDQSLPAQYATYMGDLAHGDLGMSITTRRPVTEDIAQFFPATIELTVAALLLVALIGLPLGLAAGLLKGRMPDHLIRLLSISAVSMPVFWLGIVLQIIFYEKLAILPASGRIGELSIPPAHVTGFYVLDSLFAGDFAAFGSALAHLVLPAFTLAAGSLAVITRMTRASVVETSEADHLRAARAKGLSNGLVIRRHVVRNALLPVTTVFGLQVGTLLAGSILTEVVFSWPGIGLYAVNAISNLDYTAIMGVTLLISAIYLAVNLVTDLLYLLLDPRIADAQEAMA